MKPRDAAPTPPLPEGPPWSLPMGEAPFVFFDLEMTGLDPARDRIVEVCAERVRGGVVEARLASLVNPPERAGGAAEIHGLDAAALAGAPPFTAIADELLRLFEGAIPVAHATAWDMAFLEAELARAGHETALPHYLDTLLLARRAFAFPRYSLEALCSELHLSVERFHRAEGDVLALRQVFARCVEVLAPVSPRDLWEVRIGERRARAAIVDACEAAAKHAAPVQLVYRPSRKPPEPLVMVVQEVRSDLDPPRVLGYLLPGRGRRELRADRILRVEPGPSA